jgi:hypothetical protein
MIEAKVFTRQPDVWRVSSYEFAKSRCESECLTLPALKGKSHDAVVLLRLSIQAL